MAEQQTDDEQVEEGEGTKKPNPKKKLIIIIVAAVLLLSAIGGAAYFFFFMGNDAVEKSADNEAKTEQVMDVAIYVPMPRPFVFNVVDGKRDRLVQIKVQLLVRGAESAALAKKHIPLLEGTLVSVFSEASVNKLRSPEGKKELRSDAVIALNQSIKKLEDVEIVDSVLFTGFVLQ